MKRLGIAVVSLLPLLALLALGRAAPPDPFQISLALTALSSEEAAALDLEARGAVQRPASSRARAVLQLRHRSFATGSSAAPSTPQPVAPPAPVEPPSPPPKAPLPLPTPPVAGQPRVEAKAPAPRLPAPRAPLLTPPTPPQPAPAAPVPQDLSKKLLEDARKILQRAGLPPPRAPEPGWKGSRPPPKKEGVRIHGDPRPPPGQRQGPKVVPKQGGKQGPPPDPSQPHPPPKQDRPRPR